MAASHLPADSVLAERGHLLWEAIAASAALEAAGELGVVDRLKAGPVAPGQLARDCGLGERGAQLLLAALAGLGVVAASGDGSYHGEAADLAALAALQGLYKHLAEAIRTDQPVVVGDTSGNRSEEAERLYPGVVPRPGTMLAGAADRAAEYLASPGQRVLDLGAGAAPWSIALAVKDPSCRVTAVGLPAAMPATRRAVAAAGLEQQFECLSGELLALDWGQSAYDLAIAGNLCQLLDEALNRRLLARIYHALRPCGRLAILDVLPSERMDGPRSVVLYALGLLLRASGGRVYPFSTYVGWLREAGYEAVERADLPEALPISLITARRPG